MKKVLIGVITYIVFLLIYFLQANFFSNFTIAGVAPNLFVIFIVFLGLFSNNYFALGVAVIAGLTIDFEIGKGSVGATAIMLVIVSAIASYLDKNFSKDSKITVLIMVAISTIVFEVGLYIINMFLYDFEAETNVFVRVLAIETIYNIILTFILYGLIRKLGNVVERSFKDRNILTRYF